MGNLKTIQCPSCGSKKVKYLDDNMFECLNCQTSFYVDTNQTSVNHKHTYTNVPHATVTPVSNKKVFFIVVGILVAAFLFMIPLFLFEGNSSSKSTTSAGAVKEDYSFNLSSSVAFTDASQHLKIFITGGIKSSNYHDNPYKGKSYWAVYDVVKGAFEQIEPLSVGQTTSHGFPDTECFKFDDDNVYIIASDRLLFRYDAVTKRVDLLNNDIMAQAKELQSGIASVSDASHNFSAFQIKSNSGKSVTYYPVSNVYNTDNFEYTLEKHSYPNDQPTTMFFQTNNEPSYLVRYTALYSKGYPFCFDPIISSTFDEDENFKSAAFGSYWITASRLIDLEVLNPNNKVYGLTVLDFRDGIVALGVKTNNVSSEKYKIQWQDYNGNLLWSAPSEDSHLYDFSGAISKTHGFLYGSRNNYFYYSSKGQLVKKLNLEELSFDLD